MEAEYQAAGLAGREALWIRKLLRTLGLNHLPVVIQCDNEAALCLLHNPMNTKHSKHIDVIHHFVRERVLLGELDFVRVDTSKNVSDCLTKFVPAEKLSFCRSHMGLS